MIQISDWNTLMNKCLLRINLLQELFAVTIEGYHQIYLNLESKVSSEPFNCIDIYAGVLVWGTTAGKVRSGLQRLQWQFVVIILAEWEAIVEEFLHNLVDAFLSINPNYDANRINKDIFRGSYQWRNSILKFFAFDIAPKVSPVAWPAIREWIEIRNCIIHRSKFVDQIFLDRLMDEKGNLKYPYVVGEEFIIHPGEIFQLLAGTEHLLEMLGKEIEVNISIASK